ncbi:MAG: hypothetical protein OEZ01_11885 [Candidatus Heimdallarchaeota archaeon]|nr:hypothetical protein [Candidatus Heimdallarchaeota archaeon]MDH5733674.1 hypothetical protein [Candidatus Bathyarchaeota archaeon]
MSISEREKQNLKTRAKDVARSRLDALKPWLSKPTYANLAIIWLMENTEFSIEKAKELQTMLRSRYLKQEEKKSYDESIRIYNDELDKAKASWKQFFKYMRPQVHGELKEWTDFETDPVSGEKIRLKDAVQLAFGTSYPSCDKDPRHDTKSWKEEIFEKYDGYEIELKLWKRTTKKYWTPERLEVHNAPYVFEIIYRWRV